MNEGKLTLTSPCFDDKERIPKKHAYDEGNVSPCLEISNIPKGTVSFALLVEDPDAFRGNWIHWMMWNIPPVKQIEQNKIPKGAVEGMNDFREKGYGGPCSPFGTHRYVFKLFALDTELNLPESATKRDLEKAISKHIIGQTELIGTYSI
jgi:Raf kinase inhibitor-like YbhB/YbcL family protein